MDAKEFIRLCYLLSEPSVDLDKTTEKVDCSKHTLKCSVWDAILRAYAGDDKAKRTDAAMWCVCSGPQLVED